MTAIAARQAARHRSCTPSAAAPRCTAPPLRPGVAAERSMSRAAPEESAMQLMGAELRKIGFKEGLMMGLFSLAFTAGLAMAFQSTGRDPWEAANIFVPLFIGSLTAAAGISPMKSPKLVALVIAGAAGLMKLVEWGTPALQSVA
ncbi:hypothetical protein ACFFGH_08070 [Lysobacter korlensis]|uniref:Uncharacterized protein n=1 Tax=Lysobacter korlensis TaxID=553636 RepID=A0ABV6RLD6_9GAMM